MKEISKIIAVLFIFHFIPSFLNAQTEPEMVFVKGGTFRMGSNNGDKDEKPIHLVTVRSFYISKHEITVKQYKVSFLNRSVCKIVDHQIHSHFGGRTENCGET